MIAGLSIENFTILHVAISLIGIVSGLIVLFGMLRARRLPGWTALFLATTVLTSVTGFMFPINGLTPAIVVGVISIVILAIALMALYVKHLSGAWRWIYVTTALAALYFNVFVLIVQSFRRCRRCKNWHRPIRVRSRSLGVVLVAFLVLGTMAARRFRPGP
jgi:hypothetical protein